MNTKQKAVITQSGRHISTPSFELNLDKFSFGDGCNGGPPTVWTALRTTKLAYGEKHVIEHFYLLVGACCKYYMIQFYRYREIDVNDRTAWKVQYVTPVESYQTIIPLDNGYGAFVGVSEINFMREEKPLEIGVFDHHNSPFAAKDLSQYGYAVASAIAPHQWAQRAAIKSLQSDKLGEAFKAIIEGPDKVATLSMADSKIAKTDYSPHAVAEAIRQHVPEDWSRFHSQGKAIQPSLDGVVEYYLIYEAHRKAGWVDIEVESLING
jgi:hypothetical protein